MKVKGKKILYVKESKDTLSFFPLQSEKVRPMV